MSKWLWGMSIGIGVGYLNANMLAVPGWANILLMGGIAMFAAWESEVSL